MRTEAANAAMQGVLERVRARDATEIDPDLAAYLDDGLSLGPDRSIVAIASARHAYAERGQFEDLVGYEAFANKIHVDDWGERLHHAPVDEQLSQALLLAERVGQLAAQLGVVVAVIISIDVGTESVVFRFHGMRPDELPWLAADLEGYQEPVLLRIYR